METKDGELVYAYEDKKTGRRHPIQHGPGHIEKGTTNPQGSLNTM